MRNRCGAYKVKVVCTVAGPLSVTVFMKMVYERHTVKEGVLRFDISFQKKFFLEHHVAGCIFFVRRS